MSPTPGRSTLITSAPSQASSWVQVGPDCTWVKSRMRTPSSALPACPHGLVVGAGRLDPPFPRFALPPLPPLPPVIARTTPFTLAAPLLAGAAAALREGDAALRLPAA